MFLGTIYQKEENIPNGHNTLPNGYKIYQMAIKYTKWLYNIPNGYKIYQMAIKYTKWL
jgi:hypothetical protein